jgi:ferric-dicitrate binding protein FerR (iron transport regulator)
MDRELLYRYLKCETTPDEEVVLLDWLEASADNRRELATMQMTMEGMVLADASVHNSNILDHTAQRRRGVFRVNRVVRWSASAAAVLVAAAGIGYGVATSMLGGLSQQMTVVEIPAGQRMSMTLADGTQVWLNSGTKLEYPAVFARNERRVKISGEAMFDVEHDADRPFIVETFACELEVLGTKFNVVAEPSNNNFSASLFEGRLKISENNSDCHSVILSPDEKVAFDNGRLVCNLISDHDDYLWTDGVLNLDNLTFEEAMRKFELYYGIDVVIERKSLPQIKYKGKIRVSDGVDYALHLLMSASEFTYIKSDDRNTIYIR